MIDLKLVAELNNKMKDWVEEAIKITPKGFTLETNSDTLLRAGAEANKSALLASYINQEAIPHKAVLPATLVDSMTFLNISKEQILILLKNDEKEFANFMLGEVSAIPKCMHGDTSYKRIVMVIVKAYMHLKGFAIFDNPKVELVRKNYRMSRLSKPQRENLNFMLEWESIGNGYFMFTGTETETKTIKKHTPILSAYTTPNIMTRGVNNSVLFYKVFIEEALSAYFNMDVGDWEAWDAAMVDEKYNEGKEEYNDEEDFLS